MTKKRDDEEHLWQHSQFEQRMWYETWHKDKVFSGLALVIHHSSLHSVVDSQQDMLEEISLALHPSPEIFFRSIYNLHILNLAENIDFILLVGFLDLKPQMLIC